MKRVLIKISDIIFISVLCLTLFLTAVTPVAFAVGGVGFTDCLKQVGNQSEVQEDDLRQLVDAYVDFYSDLGQGDFIAALADGTLDIPLSWFSLTTGAFEDVASAFVLPKDTLVMHPAGYEDLLYYINEAGALAVYDGFNSVFRDVEETDEARIDGDTFSKICTQLSDHYGPKNTADYISWRTDKRFAEVVDTLSAPRLSFFTDGYFCGESTWTECFVVPWYTDGTTDYFAQYQFHFYQVVSEDDNGKRVITMYCDVWDMLNGGDVQTLTISDQVMDYRYIDFSVSTENARLFMTPYASYTDYINRTRIFSATPSFTMTDNIGKNIVYASDGLTTANINDYLSCWQKAVTTHDEGDCALSDAHDTGYYVSNKPIEMDFSGVDFSKFTAEDTVTLSGDTIYDYTITNSTTGDSTTVYNYITNNYNYPVTDSGDSGEDEGGSASGNVNVSGNIDVGGSVDVNVNVNTNGSADGGSMPVDVDLNNYLEQTPEQAKPITEFFSIFFDFLPPELLGLICLGVAVAIILRIWGR